MNDFFEIVLRELIYLWYYFDLQVRQIFVFWVLGILIGSAISVFAKDKIHKYVEKFGNFFSGIFGLFLASVLGILSPLCMYGTIPICASFSKKGIKDDFLASFMTSSILLNPQLIIYSARLGVKVLIIRIVTCFFCGFFAGILVRFFFVNMNQQKEYFNFSSFAEPLNNDIDKNILLCFVKNVFRNIKATGIYFLIGIILSAIFQRYVPSDLIENLFGKNKGFGLLMAATMGVPLYVCGGGTIPLLQTWLLKGMSLGSASCFMIVGPATKITNLGALKIALGSKHFLLYLLYVIFFSVICGALINLFF